MKKMLLLTAVLFAAASFAAELKIDFNAATPWKEIRNHSKRLQFENKEFKGKKATVVTLAPKTKPADTALSLATPRFSVKGKKSITVKFTFLATKGMKGYVGGGWWNSAVRWYDAANKEVTPAVPLTMPVATGEWQSVTREAPVPAKAVSAYVHFGFDHPNIGLKDIFAITDVVITY